jgi:stage II sporulation protein AA (anti-sigma F factor antagonist)
MIGGDRMTIDVRDVGGIHVVLLEGQVRISSQNDFKDYLDRLSVDFGAQTVLLNMAGVSYLNSAGIGIIVDSFKKFREKNGRLTMCSLSQDIFRLFEVTRLNRFIDIFENETIAVEKLKA